MTRTLYAQLRGGIATCSLSLEYKHKLRSLQWQKASSCSPFRNIRRTQVRLDASGQQLLATLTNVAECRSDVGQCCSIFL